MSDPVEKLIEAAGAHALAGVNGTSVEAAQAAADLAVAKGKVMTEMLTRVKLRLGSESETGFGEVEVSRDGYRIFTGVGMGAMSRLVLADPIERGAVIVLVDPGSHVTMDAAARFRESIVAQAGHDQFTVVVTTGNTELEVINRTDLTALREKTQAAIDGLSSFDGGQQIAYDNVLAWIDAALAATPA